MNVYRYVAYGELSIARPERFAWGYSHVHLYGYFGNGTNVLSLDYKKGYHLNLEVGRGEDAQARSGT